MSQPRYGSPNDSGRNWRNAAYGGAGLSLAGGGAYALGREQYRQGSSAMRDGFTRSQGSREAYNEASRNLKPADLRPDGKVDGRKRAGRELSRLKLDVEDGYKQFSAGRTMKRRAVPVKYAGLAALAAGVGALGAGIVGNDRARAKSLRPQKSNVTSMSEYRRKAAEASGGFVAQADGKARQGYHDPAPKPVDAKMRDYFVRNGMVDAGASDAEVQALARRLRANGR